MQRALVADKNTTGVLYSKPRSTLDGTVSYDANMLREELRCAELRPRALGTISAGAFSVVSSLISKHTCAMNEL